MRRAVFEHECWQQGRSPNSTAEVTITKPAVNMFGQEAPSIATVDEHGYLINIQYISEEALAAYLRERLLDPEGRFKLAAQTGIPELAYLDRLRPSDASLPLSEVADLYFNKRKKKIGEKTKKENRRYLQLQGWSRNR